MNNFTQTTASAFSSSAMGRETISKSRVSPKNVRSRGNFLKFTFLLMAAIFAVNSYAATSYTITGTGSNLTLTITGTGNMPNYSYGNYAPWYSQRGNIKTLVINSGVTGIGNYAFYNCSGLTSVTIPDAVTSIGFCAFDNCSSLTSITIPNSVTSIEVAAFGNCSSLTSITIPNSVTSIGNNAFRNCSGLTSVTIPNSVTSIGYYAFLECSSLTSINIGANNPNYSSLDGILYNKTQTTLIQCPAGKTGQITIPNSVTSIEACAFYNCSGLTSVTIPNYVTTIEIQAFQDCSGLTTVNFNATNCTTMGSSSYPVFQGCTALATLNIGTNVTKIPDYAFYNCSGLTGTLTIPNAVTSIGNYAFYGCSGITGTLTIPNTVTSIGNYAFRNCNHLTSLTIGNSVTGIGDYAFASCSGLTSITSYKSTPPVPTITTHTFDNVPNYIPVYIPCGMKIHYQNSAAWSGDFYDFVDILAQNTIAVQSNDNAKGSAQVTQQPTCTNPQATIQAYPNSGYYFLKWSDNNTYNPRTLSVTQDIALTAIFEFNGIGEVTDSITLPNGQSIIVVPDTTTAQVAWSANADATGYTLIIYGSNHTDIICSLELNAYGQLTGIVFGQNAPQHIPQHTEDLPSAFNIKVTNLSENTTYFYKMETLGENNSILDTKEGTFTTLGAEMGINEITDNSVIIYPNPVNDELKIENSEGNINSVEIFDVSGCAVGAGRALPLHNGGQTINVSSLPAGVYLIKIETDRGTKTERFIKK
ncbi:MAG: leucine-rich repeat protein [Prevotellaceae bacterium]|jgi:hypothetical protein|nr:leucine-rich repeat protein [Prevotellaceae bacterium]